MLLRNAIVADEFLRDLDASQIKDIVSVMFPMDYDKGAQFVKENEPGNFVYVMESGKALASRNEKVLFKIFLGKLFGEPQAMLYNSPRWVPSGLHKLKIKITTIFCACVINHHRYLSTSICL